MWDFFSSSRKHTHTHAAASLRSECKWRNQTESALSLSAASAPTLSIHFTPVTTAARLLPQGAFPFFPLFITIPLSCRPGCLIHKNKLGIAFATGVWKHSRGVHRARKTHGLLIAHRQEHTNTWEYVQEMCSLCEHTPTADRAAIQRAPFKSHNTAAWTWSGLLPTVLETNGREWQALEVMREAPVSIRLPAASCLDRVLSLRSYTGKKTSSRESREDRQLDGDGERERKGRGRRVLCHSSPPPTPLVCLLCTTELRRSQSMGGERNPTHPHKQSNVLAAVGLSLWATHSIRW